MKSIFNTLLLTLLALAGMAQGTTYTISGTVSFGSPGGDGAPFVPVSITSNDIMITPPINLVTDPNGNFSADVIVDVQPGDTIDLLVEVMDICSNQPAIFVFSVFDGAPLQYTINTIICAGVTPPPLPDTCAAFFDLDYQGGLDVQFTFLGFASDSSNLSWTWDFGDGTSSTLLNPQHTFPDTGDYTVTLIIQTDSCDDSTTKVVSVPSSDCNCDNAPFDPVCAITLAGDVVQFDNLCAATCALDDPISLVSCDSLDCDCPDIFDPVCVTTPFGVITFDNSCVAECNGYGPGTFMDCDPDDNCTCPAIYNPVCVADSLGQIDTFTNICFAICEGYSPNDLVQCDTTCICPAVWDPVCVATLGGVITFANSCQAECAGFTDADFVPCGNNADCLADFQIQIDPDDPFTVTFTDSSFANGDIVSWSWDLGDGSVGDGPEVTHTYSDDGIYLVTLTITTDDSCTSTQAIHVLIDDNGVSPGPDCSAMFVFIPQDSAGGTQDGTFQFIDLSLGDIDSWNWDFGDGNSDTIQNPLHQFQDPGTYTVTLTVSSDSCQSVASMVVVVGPGIVYPDPDSVCQALFVPFIAPDSQTVFFLNLSLGGPAATYSWDFGNGQTSNSYNAWNVYNDPGIYTVTLTVTTANGCTSTYTVTLDLMTNSFTGNLSFLVTSIKEVRRETLQVKLAPNPAHDVMWVDLDLDTPSDLELLVWSTAGQVEWQRNTRLGAGNQRIPMDVSRLPAGVYVLQIMNGRQVTSKRFVVR